MDSQSPNVGGMAILEEMRQGVDYRFSIKCRRKSFSVRPLSVFEEIKITRTVMDRLEELDEKYRNGVTESLWLASEKLKVATTDDIDSPGSAKLTDYIIERMTPDEIDTLFKQYVAGCARVNPSLEEMPLEQIMELVEKVKKSPELSTLIDLSFLELANISSFLIKEGLLKARSVG